MTVMKERVEADTKEYRRHFTPVSPNVATLPVLYKRTNTGAVMAWSILVRANEIGTSYGLVGGVMQNTSDVVREGKNLGKRNETTPEEQAMAEAAARWRKKIEREGYVASLERAQRGETDAQGGIAPMLAQTLEDAERHVRFPCDLQPKLNGLRCIVVINSGSVTLWSRRREQILGVPHIEAAYERAFAGWNGQIVLDGEIYRHGWNLQTIGGFVRKKTGTKEGYQELSHNIYDVPSEVSEWQERRKVLYSLSEAVLGDADPTINVVQTIPNVENMRAVKAFHDDCVNRGYEGAMIRNLAAPYEVGKRSSNLIKVKGFMEREFRVVAVKSGRGRMSEGAIFTCLTDEGREFECTAPGSMQEKAAFLGHPDRVIGKQVTIRFQEWSQEKKPLQLRAIAVRDYE
jgi:DNA ligase-1